MKLKLLCSYLFAISLLVGSIGICEASQPQRRQQAQRRRVPRKRSGRPLQRRSAQPADQMVQTLELPATDILEAPIIVEKETIQESVQPTKPTYSQFFDGLKKRYDVTHADAKIMWNYGQKKLAFKTISPSESEAFWRALKRTGIPAVIIMALLGGAAIVKKGWQQESQEIQEPEKSAEVKIVKIEDHPAYTDPSHLAAAVTLSSPPQTNNEKVIVDNAMGILDIQKAMGETEEIFRDIGSQLPQEQLDELQALRNRVSTDELIEDLEEKISDPATNILLTNDQDDTLLSIVVRVGDIGLLKNLLSSIEDNSEFRIYLNASKADHKSPLHYLAEQARNSAENTWAYDAMQLLLEKGANPNIKNKEGLSVLDTLLANDPHGLNPEEQTFPINEFIRLLLSHQAKITKQPNDDMLQLLNQEQVYSLRKVKSAKKSRVNFYLSAPIGRIGSSAYASKNRLDGK